MLLSLLVLLSVPIVAYAGGQKQFLQPARNSQQAIKDIVIYTDNGPVPQYLLERQYKIVPIVIPASNSLNSRRSDEHSSPDQASQRRRSSKREDNKNSSVKNNSRTKPVSVRRQDNNGSQTVRKIYSQTIQSPDGPVAIPLQDSQKGSPSTIPSATSTGNFKSDGERYSTSTKSNQADDKSIIWRTDKTYVTPSSPTGFSGAVYQKKSPLPLPADVAVNDPKPYDFGYDINDGIGTSQYRQESSKGDGIVKGNYGYKDYQGVFRQVNYVADKDGFRALIRTNEPSVWPVDTADVTFIVDPRSPAVHESKKYLF